MNGQIAVPPWAQRILAVLVALAATITITIQFVDTDGDGKPNDITFKVNTQAGDGAPTKTITVPEPLADRAAAVTESNLKGPAKVDGELVAPQAVEDAAQKAAEIRQTQVPLPTAGASAGFDGCVTRFVSNQSSRNGVRPQHQTLHYTVSFNRPGWDDVNAIVNYFNSRSSGASSNFVIDADGNCAYIVPIEAKSWTQASANPFAISYEIIAYGNETVYLNPAGFAKLSSVMKQVSARTGIPMRRGATSGCTPTRSGIVQHYDYGTCGGGHHDIRPFSVDQVVKIVTSGASSVTTKLTKPERKIVSRRCDHWYKHQRARGAAKKEQLRYSRHWKSRATAQKRRLDRIHAVQGRPWKKLDSGVRRKSMAQTERMNKNDRKALCA